MNKIYCVKGEIHKILNSARMETGVKPNSSLLSIFSSDPSNQRFIDFEDLKSLDNSLSNCKSLNELDSYELIKPFADILRCNNGFSHHPEVLITTIKSVHKLILYSFVETDSIGSKKAVNYLAESFSDIKVDIEFIQMKKIVGVLELFKSEVGNLLENKNIISLLGAVFAPMRAEKTSEVLSKYCEDAIGQIILKVFLKLFSSTENNSKNLLAFDCDVVEPIFQFIISLLEPYNNIYAKNGGAEEFVTIGLELLIIALESGGENLMSLKFAKKVISDDICKQILHCSQLKNLKILSLTLRIVFILFSEFREDLRVQLEVFISSIHLRLGESPSSNAQQKELVVESLAEFAMEPEIISGMFRNYDCELASINLFEEIVKFLSDFATVKKDFNNRKLQCKAGDAILSILVSIKKKFCGKNLFVPLTKLDEDDNIEKKIENKKKLKQASESFNKRGRKSVPYLQKLEVIKTPFEPKSMAAFLMSTPNLSKLKIFEYLSGVEKDEIRVLKEFVKQFDFKGVEIDAALRSFLQSLAIHGESQKIFRVLEEFGIHFHDQNPELFKTADVCCVVVSAVIMLNTDLHNNEVKEKIKLEEFRKILRGIDGNENLPSEFITNLYNSIARNELKSIPSDLRSIISDKGIDKRYWNFLIGTKTNEKWKQHVSCDQGYRMLEFVWETAVQVLSARIASKENMVDVQNIEKSSRTFCEIAGFYNSSKSINKLFISISSSIVKLLDDKRALQAGGHDEECEEKKRVLISLSRFLFGLVTSHSACVLEAWHNIVFLALCLKEFEILNRSEEENAFIKEIEMLFAISFTDKGLLAVTNPLLKVLESGSIEDVFIHKIGVNFNLKKSKMYCMDLITDLVERNRVRVSLVWPHILPSLNKTLGALKEPDVFTENVLLNCLRIFDIVIFDLRTSNHEKEKIIKIILSLDDRVTLCYGKRLISWFLYIKEYSKDFIKSESIWDAFFSFIAKLTLSDTYEDIGKLVEITQWVSSLSVNSTRVYTVAELTSILAKNKRKINKKSFGLINAISESICVNSMLLQDKNKKEKIFKIIVRIYYDFTVSNDLFFQNKKVKLKSIAFLSEIILNEKIQISFEINLLEDLIENIIKPLMNYCYTFEKFCFKVMRKMKKDKSIKNNENGKNIKNNENGKNIKNNENSLYEIQKIMFLLLERNSDTFLSKKKDFDVLWVKALSLTADYAEKFYKKSGDKIYAQNFCSLLKKLVRFYEKKEGFLELKNYRGEELDKITNKFLDSLATPFRQLIVTMDGNK